MTIGFIISLFESLISSIICKSRFSGCCAPESDYPSPRMPRIIDKIVRRREQFASERAKQQEFDASRNYQAQEENSLLPAGWFYSFEFFPPATEPGLDNLLTRIDRMARRLDPLFINVTWGGGGSTAARSMAIASHAQKYLGLDVMLHLTTEGATRDDIARALDQARSSGICNILALRGDPPRGQRSWSIGETSGPDCPRAIDLVRLIRELHGDYFCVAVAGHPEGHPSSTAPEDELVHLKEKLDAGADIVLTQFFYDTGLFLDFVRRCRAAGISCPILPGIMAIQSYASFVKMTEYCRISVPNDIWELLEPVKGNNEAVKEIGCQIATKMCRRILLASRTFPDLGPLDGIHFYTMNLERSVSNILVAMAAVSFIRKASNTIQPSAGRVLPWRPSAIDKREKNEQVRPINWANRPKSYVIRTEDWDEFPNGRWGDSTSPAFGELSQVSHFFSFSLGSEHDQRALLGENPTKPQDVYDVFAQYVKGRIPNIPWCETPLQPESFSIQSALVRLNCAGYLTINSQPSVNGVVSTDPTFGWGGRGGLIYQKAYCECFCSPQHVQNLVEMTRDNSSINLYAVNLVGSEMREGNEPGGITALTWGGTSSSHSFHIIHRLTDFI